MSRARLAGARNPVSQPVRVTYSRWYGALEMREVQMWRSFERAVSDCDPFQNGAHTTWPAFYVRRQLTYMLGPES